MPRETGGERQVRSQGDVSVRVIHRHRHRKGAESVCGLKVMLRRNNNPRDVLGCMSPAEDADADPRRRSEIPGAFYGPF